MYFHQSVFHSQYVLVDFVFTYKWTVESFGWVDMKRKSGNSVNLGFGEVLNAYNDIKRFSGSF